MKPAAFALLALSLSACQTATQPSMWDITKLPLPTTEAERSQKCVNLAQEVARQESLATMAASSQFAPAMIAKSRDNIAALNARRQQIQCDIVRTTPEPATSR